VTKNIFELASRRKLRFSAPVGRISVEDLWDLPLSVVKTRPGAAPMDLDGISAVALQELGMYTNSVSLVNPKPSQGKDEAELRVEVLKHIIGVKQEEAKEARQAAARKAEVTRLKEALASKDEAKVAAMSESEIKARLAELEGE